MMLSVKDNYVEDERKWVFIGTSFVLLAINCSVGRNTNWRAGCLTQCLLIHNLNYYKDWKYRTKAQLLR